MTRLLARWAVAGCALAGCAAAAQVAPPAHEPLAGTVTLTEITSDGERLPISRDGVADVDINSRIEVRVDRARVQALFEREASATPEELARIKGRLAALGELTRAQAAMLERFASLVERRRQEGAKPALSPALAQAVQQLSADRVALNEAIGRYADAAGQPKATYFRGPGLAGTFEALDAERRAVLASLPREALRWRLQAVFAKGAPIHLDNYDSHAEGPFAVVDKLIPQASGQELAAQFAEARQLASDLRSLANAKQLVVRAALSAAREVLEPLDKALDHDLAAVEAVAGKLPEQALKIKEVAELKAQLVPLGQSLRALREPCAQILEALRQGSLEGLSASQARPCLRAVVDLGPKLLEQARPAYTAVEVLARLIEKEPARFGALVQPLKELVPELQSVKLVKGWADELEQRWAQWRPLFAASAEVAEVPVWSSDQQTDRPLAEITDTAIDLRRTERKEGDLLHLRPSMMRGDGSALVGPTADLRVVRMGLYVDISAGVAFVNERGGDDEFAAGPGVTAAAHYRWRPTSGLRRALNVLRPGIGLHFLYPDAGTNEVDAMGVVTKKDPSFELGVGGSVLLFGDLLQVGAGYNLQVGVSYWYVGFGLDTLLKLGVRFSPGS